jgi:dienelactone hydrolase
MRAFIWVIITCIVLLASTACPLAKPAGAKHVAPQAAAKTANLQAAQAPVAGAPPGARGVWLSAVDGYKVAAWFWPTGGKKSAPAIILLHQRGKDKSSWGGFPAKLVEEGFAVIAIDFRGHGQTTDPNGQSIPLNSLRDSDYQAMLNDVGAAHAYLAQQKGVDADRVGLIGASIGANLALLYAAQDRRIRTVVALSPGLDYKGLKPLAVMGPLDKRPLFLIASKGDKYALDSVQALAGGAQKDAPVSVRTFDGSAHGTDIFAAQPGLDMTIINGWLMNYLPPGALPPT